MFDLKKIKHSVDGQTWYKAAKLYEQGKVSEISIEPFGYSATVIGTEPYRVVVSTKRFDEGSCDCYLGQNDTLCKHMVAVAIKVLSGDKPLSESEKDKIELPIYSGVKGELNKNEFLELKKSVSNAIKYIKPYEGPSRKWFAYQNALDEGCSMLTEIVSHLPASRQTANFLVKLLLRLDDKLCRGGVDDSNGTVGGFMESIVELLLTFSKVDQEIKKEFGVLKGRETCFGWEESLLI